MAKGNVSLHKLLNKAINYHQKGKIDHAKKVYLEILKSNKNHSDAQHLLSLIEAEYKNFTQAEKRIQIAIKIQPQQAEFYNSFGHIYMLQNQYEKAIEKFDHAIMLNTNLTVAYYNKALTYNYLLQIEDSIEYYHKVLKMQGNNLDALNNLGAIYADQGDFALALSYFKQVLEYDPNYIKAYNNIGNLYLERGVYATAKTFYQQALKVLDTFVESKVNLAHTLRAQKKFGEAIVLYQQVSSANIFLEHKALLGTALCYVNTCNWQALNKIKDKLYNVLQEDGDFPYLAEPIELVSLRVSNKLYKKNIVKYMQKFTHLQLLHNKNVVKRNKINLAYLSCDFCFHPIGVMLSGILPFHDTDIFNVFAFSLRKQDDDVQRKIQESVNFIDCSSLSDQAVVELIKEYNIDVLIDLSGYTKGSRTNIVVQKPAPIIASWLGYAASSWLPEIDYYITTKIHVPESMQHLFSEKIVYLPDSIIACDLNMPEFNFTNRLPLKTTYNLPEDKLIFANFNQAYRIDQEVFETWMCILNNVPNSVLWLAYKEDVEFVKNIRYAAAKNNISADRLVFKETKLLNSDWHLGLVDIYLDTFFESGGTTSILAMCAGVPVVTKTGKNPESRIAADLLNAMQINELVADSVSDYIEIATAFAVDASKLAQLQAKIFSHKKTCALFKPQKFIVDLERVVRGLVMVE